MVRYLKWQNMFSFHKEGELSFEVAQQAQGTAYADVVTGVRLSKVAALVGPNASGKSNALRVLAAIQNLILYRPQLLKGPQASEAAPLKHLYQPYGGHHINKEPSEFEVSFFVGRVNYVYFMRFDAHQILHERLEKIEYLEKAAAAPVDSAKAPTSASSKAGEKNAVVFEREGGELGASSSDVKTILQLVVRKDASIVSSLRATSYKCQEVEDVCRFWQDRVMDIRALGWATSIKAKVNQLSQWYLRDKKLLKNLKTIFKDCDLGDHELKFERTLATQISMPMSDRRQYKPSARQDSQLQVTPYLVRRHPVTGQKFESALVYEPDSVCESNGVLQLFCLFGWVYEALKRDCLMFVDEIDWGLHVEVVSKIIGLFMDETNAHGQMLFATHMSPLLMALEKDQVHIVEKNESNESDVYRMDQVEDASNSTDVFKNYISGRCGGVPDIDPLYVDTLVEDDDGDDDDSDDDAHNTRGHKAKGGRGRETRGDTIAAKAS